MTVGKELQLKWNERDWDIWMYILSLKDNKKK